MKRLCIALICIMQLCASFVHGMEKAKNQVPNEQISPEEIVFHAQISLPNDSSYNLTIMPQTNDPMKFFMVVKGIPSDKNNVFAFMFQVSNNQRTIHKYDAGKTYLEKNQNNDDLKKSFKDAIAKTNNKAFEKEKLSEELNNILEEYWNVIPPEHKASGSNKKLTKNSHLPTSTPSSSFTKPSSSWFPFIGTAACTVGVIATLIYYRELVGRGLMTFLKHGFRGFFAKR